MAQITFPAACEVCQDALHGAAKLALKRESDDYFLDVSQTEKLDWGICPRCKLVACFAVCFDIKRGYCKSCPSFDETGNCPDCGRVLTGAVEVVQTEMFGMPAIAFEETSDRNWIECDGCSRVMCKACCRKPKSGCCNACLNDLEENGAAATIAIAQTKPLPEYCPVVTTTTARGAFHFDAAQSATGNSNTGNNEQSRKTMTGGQFNECT